MVVPDSKMVNITISDNYTMHHNALNQQDSANIEIRGRTLDWQTFHNQYASRQVSMNPNSLDSLVEYTTYIEA